MEFDDGSLSDSNQKTTFRDPSELFQVQLHSCITGIKQAKVAVRMYAYTVRVVVKYQLARQNVKIKIAKSLKPPEIWTSVKNYHLLKFPYIQYVIMFCIS